MLGLRTDSRFLCGNKSLFMPFRVLVSIYTIIHAIHSRVSLVSGSCVQMCAEGVKVRATLVFSNVLGIMFHKKDIFIPSPVRVIINNCSVWWVMPHRKNIYKYSWLLSSNGNYSKSHIFFVPSLNCAS